VVRAKWSIASISSPIAFKQALGPSRKCATVSRWAVAGRGALSDAVVLSC